MRIRRVLAILGLGLMLSLATPASARVTAPALVSVHHAVDRTHYWQARNGSHLSPYHWVADRRSTPTWKRWRIAGVWWSRAAQAHHRYTLQPRTCLAAIHKYFPAYAWSSAISIAQRESGLSTYAKNPSSSASGCFQLMSFWWDGSSAYGWVFNPFDAAENTQHAVYLWAHDGGSFCPGQWCL